MIMETIKVKNKGVKMIAHRGLSGIECENTNAAFVAAGNRSYFGIETDIHVTKDGKFVVIHDDKTSRVAKEELIVEECTLDELRKIRLLDTPRQNADFTRSDLCLPELCEYIRICKRYDKKAVLELKNRFETEDIKKVIDEIKKQKYIDNVIFISFSWENMVDIRNILPKAKAQFLISKWDDELIEKLKAHNLDLDIHYKALSKDKVKLLHKNGIEVNCWTVDDASDAKKLISMGVDYITSNILE